MAANIFFVDGAGASHGPITTVELKRYWDGGFVNQGTHVFTSDGSLKAWTPLGKVPHLLAHCKTGKMQVVEEGTVKREVKAIVQDRPEAAAAARAEADAAARREAEAAVVRQQAEMATRRAADQAAQAAARQQAEAQAAEAAARRRAAEQRGQMLGRMGDGEAGAARAGKQPAETTRPRNSSGSLHDALKSGAVLAAQAAAASAPGGGA